MHYARIETDDFRHGSCAAQCACIIDLLYMPHVCFRVADELGEVAETGVEQLFRSLLGLPLKL